MWLVRKGLWGYLTQDDEDGARRLLRRALYPEAPAARLPRGEAARPLNDGLSEDARYVRNLINHVRQNLGREPIPELEIWPSVSARAPEWTRERWAGALAELRGEVRPVAVGSVL